MKYFNQSIKIYILLLVGVSISFVIADDAVNPAQDRQCYSCEGINCQRTTKQNVTTSCTDLLDICVTIFDQYSVIAKGCYSDMSENLRRKCDEHKNPECLKCFGQLCNNKGREDFKCIECNDASKCAEDTTSMQSVQCPIPTAPNSYCYVRKLNGNQIQRGCLVHQQDQLKCLKDATCSMCLSNDGEACNSYKISTALTPSTTLPPSDIVSSAIIEIPKISILLFTLLALLR